MKHHNYRRYGYATDCMKTACNLTLPTDNTTTAGCPSKCAIAFSWEKPRMIFWSNIGIKTRFESFVFESLLLV